MDTSSYIYYTLIIAAILLLSLFGYAVYCGLFHKIIIQTKASPFPALRVAYKFVKGPYEKVGGTFEEASKIAPQNDCLGIYYDDPREVEGPEQRCIVGSVLSDPKGQTDKDLEKTFQEKGYKVADFPKVKNIVHATFPYKSKLSIYIAVWRVWPAITAYGDKTLIEADPWMEYYTCKQIHFIGMLDHQQDFMVPEVRK